MTTALINPPYRISQGNIGSGVSVPPLWLSYITGALRAKNLPLLVLDAQGEGLDQKWQLQGRWYRGLTPAQIINRLPPDVTAIGLSCMFSGTWPLMRVLLKELRLARPAAVLVIGGEHATALPKLVLTQSEADVVVTGEGEETAQALFALIHAQAGAARDYSGVAGLVWKDAAGRIHDEGRRARLRAVDEIALPDWSDLPMEKYFAQKGCLGTYQGPFMPMLATRGCPYQCTYCSSPNMWTTRWVARDPEKVLDEMESYTARYGARDFQFQDLTAVLKRTWILAFCAAIERRGLKITWQFPIGTRTEAISEEVAQAMARAGCINFALPFESGDAAILSRVKKNASTPRQIRAAKAALKAGIRVGGFVMVGFPFETWRSLWLSYLLVLGGGWMGLGEVHMNPFMPLPGTEEFRRLEAAGKVTLSDEYFEQIFNWQSLGRQVSYSGVLSTPMLRWLVVFSYLSFFAVSWLRRPWRLVGEVLALFGLKPDRGRFSKALRGQKALFQLAQVPVGTLLSEAAGPSAPPATADTGVVQITPVSGVA